MPDSWDKIPPPPEDSASVSWDKIPPPPEDNSVSVQEPKQEMENVWLSDFNMTVGIPKQMSNDEKSNLLYEQFFAQKYVNPFKDKPEAPSDIPQPEGKPTVDIDGRDLTDLKGFGEQLLKDNPLGDLAAPTEPSVDDIKPTETLPMDTALAVTSGFRQATSEILEKPQWAIFEGVLRAAKAVYKYAPDSSTDFDIKMSEKQKTIGRLNKWIEYYNQPEKFGYITPQVSRDQEETRAFLKMRAADERFHRRNYAYQMLNEFAQAGMTLASFFGSIGIAEKVALLGKAPKAIKYTGTAMESLKIGAMKAAKVMAPYAILTTKGDFSARMHSAVMLSAFSMVNPIVALTGWNRVNASMLAILINHAITIPEIKEMYKQSKGVNEDFWLLLAPLIAQNIAFGIFFQRTPEAQRRAIKERRIKNIAEDFGVSKKTAEEMIRVTEKAIKEADKYAPKEGEFPPDVQPYAVDINPVDYKIPKKIEIDKSQKKGSRAKQVYPELQNKDTLEGLYNLEAELEMVEKSSYAPRRNVEGGVAPNSPIVKIDGYSPEHLRDLGVRKKRNKKVNGELVKAAESDLDNVRSAIAGKPITKTAYNKIVDMLTAQEAYDKLRFISQEDVQRQRDSAGRALQAGNSDEAIRATDEASAKEAARIDAEEVKAEREAIQSESGDVEFKPEEEAATLEWSVVKSKGHIIFDKNGMEWVERDGKIFTVRPSNAIDTEGKYAGFRLGLRPHGVHPERVPQVIENLKTYGTPTPPTAEPPFGSSENPVVMPKPEEPKTEAPKSEQEGDTTSQFALDKLAENPAFMEELAKQVAEGGNPDIAKYFRANMKEQRELVADLEKRDPDLLELIAITGEVPPSEKGLLPMAAYAHVLNKATENADGKLGLELMRSPLAGQVVSQSGSTLSILSHMMNRNGVDPVATIKNIEKALEKTGAKKNATQAERTKARQELEMRIKLLEERAIKAEQEFERYKASRASERANTGGEYGSRNKIFTKEMADAAAKKLRESLLGLHAGVDPTLLVEVVKIGGYHVESGLHEFKAWSDKMVADFGDKIKPYLKTAWQQIQDQIDRAAITNAKDKIAENINNEKDIGFYIQFFAEHAIARGIKGREKILDWVQKEVNDVVPNMTRREIADAISGYGKYKPLNMDEVKVQLRDLKGQLQNVSKLQDLESGKPPLKTGIERRKPSDEERALIQQVEEAKKKYGISTTDPETQLKSALDAVKTRLRNQIVDLDKQIDSGKKIVDEKTPLKYDKEAEALKKTRDALKEEYDKIFYKPKTDAEKIEQAVKASERTVAELERRIKENDLYPNRQTVSPWSPEISKLKQQAEALREEINVMKEAANPKLTPEERALRALKRRLEKKFQTYKEKIISLDFSKKLKKEIPLDAEGKKLKAAADMAKRAFEDVKKAAPTVTPDQAQEIFRLAKIVKDLQDKIPAGDPEDSPANLEYGRAKFDYIAYADKIRHEAEAIKPEDWRNKPLHSVGRVIYEIPGVMKAVNASMDMGHFFRQGLPLLINDPAAWGVSAIKSIEAGVKTIGGYDMMREHKALIYARENYKNGVYAEHGLDLGREENFASTIAESAPLGLGRLVKASDVAYTVFLQRARVEYFDTIYKQLKEAGESTRGIGIIANSITGRGSFGEGEAVANFANIAFFSVRNLKSRFDQLTGHLSDYGKLDTPARKIAALNTIRSYIAIGSAIVFAKIIAVATGNSDAVETDPRSTGFGKIRIFNTDIDLTGGMSSFITLVSRLFGVKDRMTGIVKPTFSEGRVERDALDVLGQFSSGKASPFFGLGMDILRNMTDKLGRKLTAGSVASRFAPITPVDVVNAFNGYNADGMTGKGLAKTLLAANIAFWGAGGSSNFPTPKQVVDAAERVSSEVDRLKKNGEPEKAMALSERTQALAMAGSALKSSQNKINDLKRKIADARDYALTDKETKKYQIDSFQNQIDSIQEVMDQTLKSINKD